MENEENNLKKDWTSLEGDKKDDDKEEEEEEEEYDNYNPISDEPAKSSQKGGKTSCGDIPESSKQGQNKKNQQTRGDINEMVENIDPGKDGMTEGEGSTSLHLEFLTTEEDIHEEGELFEKQVEISADNNGKDINMLGSNNEKVESFQPMKGSLPVEKEGGGLISIHKLLGKFHSKITKQYTREATRTSSRVAGTATPIPLKAKRRAANADMKGMLHKPFTAFTCTSNSTLANLAQEVSIILGE